MGHLIHKIDEHTWLIEEEGMCNVYMFLLEGTREAVLLDTGLGTIPLDEIVASLTDRPVTVVCTHGHFDHIGGNGYFPRIMMHRNDRHVYQEHKRAFQAMTPGIIAPEAPEELEWFESDMTLDLGDRVLEVFHTPGHTVGAIAVLDRERRLLYTGDTCCKAAVLLNFDHSTDVPAFRESICQILARQDRFDVIWPSHHAKPINVRVPEQFLRACELLISGQAQTRKIDSGFGAAEIFVYEDIQIIF